MLSLLSRTPFTILGAVALFNLAGDVIAVHQKIQAWLDVWQSVTRPIWHYTIGRIYDISDLQKDYLSIGLITMGAMIRNGYDGYDLSKNGEKTSTGFHWTDLIILFLWPLYIIFRFFALFQFLFSKENRHLKKYSDLNFMIFFETYIYALILLCLNYALFIL